MEVSTTQHKRTDVVKVTGRIDSDTSPKLKKVLDDLLEEGRYNIVLDLEGVDFISSGGVWVILETQKACRKWNRGDVVLTNVNENIDKTLDLAGLKHFLRIYDDVTTAVGSF